MAGVLPATIPARRGTADRLRRGDPRVIDPRPTEGDEMTVIKADDTTPESSDAQIGQARPGVAGGDPGMDGAGQQLSGTGAGDLTR